MKNKFIKLNLKIYKILYKYINKLYKNIALYKFLKLLKSFKI